MKVKISIIFTILLLSSGCTYNELPPKTDDASINYLEPKGVLATQEERDIVEAAKDEYEKATR